MPSEGKKCPKCGSQLLKEERLHADGTATYLAHVCIKCFYRVRVCPKCGAEMEKLRWDTQDNDTKGWVEGEPFWYCEQCGHEEKVR